MEAITQEQMLTYLAIRDSELTNMFNVDVVIRLSNGVLDREAVKTIMQNFNALQKKWSNS